MYINVQVVAWVARVVDKEVHIGAPARALLVQIALHFGGARAGLLLERRIRRGSALVRAAILLLATAAMVTMVMATVAGEVASRSVPAPQHALCLSITIPFFP